MGGPPVQLVLRNCLKEVAVSEDNSELEQYISAATCT
jgi:hypothetical protein